MNRGSTFLARASLLNTIDLRVLALALGTFAIGTDAFIIGGILPEIAQVRQHRQDRIGRFGILPVIRTRLAHRLGANPSRPKNPCSRLRIRPLLPIVSVPNATARRATAVDGERPPPFTMFWRASRSALRCRRLRPKLNRSRSRVPWSFSARRMIRGSMIRPRLPVGWRMRAERNRLGHASADPLQHAGHDLMVCHALAWIEIPSSGLFSRERDPVKISRRSLRCACGPLLFRRSRQTRRE
jgi:hypothetical protein